jgi:hypothetical protein
MDLPTPRPSPSGARLPRGGPSTRQALLLALLLLPAAAAAEARVAHLSPTATPPVLDGVLDEPLWREAAVLGDFVQQQPREGAAPLQSTEVRLARDADFLYVAARLFDTEPAAVRRHLTRRDTDTQADWFEVAVDGYHDRRSAQGFRVNASGVQRDVLYFDDVQQDARWDAVWRSAVAHDAGGWTVELAIPLSQLRFTPGAARWGLQLTRFLFRERETSAWQPIPLNQGVHVSRFGELVLDADLSPPPALEVRPYLAGASRASAATPRAFRDGQRLAPALGADVRWQPGPGLQLNGTVLPDFGQVDLDPLLVNLTDQQQYFAEQRPFFLEGLDLLAGQASLSANGPNTTWPALLYTRRLGGAPRARPARPGEAAHTDRPAQTPIYGALKLSGRTPQGTSFGLLDALTAPADERYADASGAPLPGAGASQQVQPLTHFLLGRAQQELGGGAVKLGLTGTSVHRWLPGGGSGPLSGLLPEDAVSGGADWSVRFLDNTHYVSGALLGSRVAGSRQAITALQRSPVRYLQRPDARHLGVDADATALLGGAGELRLGRSGDRGFNWEVRGSGVTPGFEVNDLGFQNRADEATLGTRLQWQDLTPGPLLQRWTVTSHATLRTTFGGEALPHILNADVDLLTRDFLPLGAFLFAAMPGNTDRLLRGGPRASQPLYGALFLRGGTDVRRAVRGSFSFGGAHSLAGQRELSGHVLLEGEPLPALTFRLQPAFSFWSPDLQYVGDWADPAATATGGRSYLLGRLENLDASVEARLEWTFSPTLSLQTSGRVGASAGRHGGYGLFAAPGERRLLAPELLAAGEDGTLTVQAPGSTVRHTLDTPDYRFSSLQGAAVLRWEYLPGSTLSAAYQLTCQQAQAGGGTWEAAALLSPCGESAPQHAVMARLTYWWHA